MNIIKKILKGIGFSIVAVVLATIGIDAADNYDNLSGSIIGKIVFNAPDGPCPADMAFIPTENNGFCIDKYEAAAGGDCVYIEIKSQEETRVNLDRKSCQPVSGPGKIPWRFISQSQAAMACAKAGKRLPTSEEWYLASLGTPDLSAGWQKTDCQVNKNWDKQPGPTGTAENCASSYGAYDMVGNVWEWVKGEIRDGQIGDIKLPPSGFINSVDSSGLPTETNTGQVDLNYNEDYFWIKENDIRGIARGGYWDNNSDAGMYAMYLVSPPSFAGTGVGFRCAK